MTLFSTSKDKVFQYEDIAVAFAVAAEDAGVRTMLLTSYTRSGQRIFIVRRIDPFDIN